ncbi:MFS transporter [Cohnella lubricantis]|uniref:MFS transporter n=1 Tax=Cohnella lubricantis TaxID=2163172 RepID=A0A841TJF9_9BACL|nr:MFS transporter [Cohnella lubricantis]MBB6679340.1 MFS transporter [Cohnella lubricantis]MBP2120131.1 MFS family permease [Cohnella lubricantis]
MKFKDWDLNLKIRLGGEAATNLLFWTFYPFLSIYFAESFGKSWAGLLLVFSQILSVFANLIGGYCADRFGRKRMMVIATAGQSFGYGLFALAATPWIDWPAASFAGFSISSLFGAIYWPASQAMVADVVPEKEQSHVFAIFYTSTNMAVVLGPLIGTQLYVNYPFAVLGAAAVVCALISIVLGHMLTETRPRGKEAVSSASVSWRGAVWNQLRQYRIIASDRVFLMYITGGILVAQTFMQLDLLFPVYLEDTIRSVAFLNWQLTGEGLFGIIVSENGLMVVLFTVLVTRIMNGLRDRYAFIGGSLIFAAGIYLFSQASGFWGFFAVMAVFTLAELMTAGLQQTFIARLAPEHMRGQYYAAASLRYTIGRTIAPLSIPLGEWIGYKPTFLALAVLAVLSAVVYNQMFNWHEQPARSTS